MEMHTYVLHSMFLINSVFPGCFYISKFERCTFMLCEFGFIAQHDFFMYFVIVIKPNRITCLFFRRFFERIILCNSLVWTCAATGKTGLTFQEALESEHKALKQIANFPPNLLKPVLFLASLTHRAGINDLSDDIYHFAKDRYFVNETVDVLHDDEK